MGNCTVKTSAQLEPQLKLVIPSCSYFNRKNKNLFEITNDKITKYKLEGRLRSYQNSCVGTVSGNRILIIGGSDFTGSLTNRAFMIDVSSKLATEIAPSPKAVKEGNLLEVKGFYYFVGGTVETEDSDLPVSEEGAPIMRYNTKENFWEVFSHNFNSTTTINKVLKRKITDRGGSDDILSVDSRKISLKNLISAGAFVFESRIYLVGGKIYQEGSYMPTDKIFSFGVRNDEFDLREESLKLPLKLVSPVCSAGENHAFITGGYMENGYPNVKMFVIKFSQNEVLACHARLDSALEEIYPPTYLENEIVIFSFPKIWIKPKKEDKAHVFTFYRKKVKQTQTKEISVGKNKQWKPAQEKSVDLSIVFKVDNEAEERKRRSEAKADAEAVIEIEKIHNGNGIGDERIHKKKQRKHRKEKLHESDIEQVEEGKKVSSKEGREENERGKKKDLSIMDDEEPSSSLSSEKKTSLATNQKRKREIKAPQILSPEKQKKVNFAMKLERQL